ncbi:hypothetical protein [Lentzea indica]|uniref:hypothetical protein n=1 Tax=Lentzea indica TaxID=2604800 RepID=UPI00143B8E94|nr:hypothetical protein [Lentzea indica]
MSQVTSSARRVSAGGGRSAAAGELAARIVALPSRTDTGIRAAVEQALATNGGAHR